MLLFFLKPRTFDIYPKRKVLWISQTGNNSYFQSFNYDGVRRKLPVAMCGFTISASAHPTPNQIHPNSNIKVSSVYKFSL